ncbi:MAG TPA: hypothetical protein DDZ80_28160 [Cyanobacteria bacterium UBA8803]|nr:hypothetical protein [Cyanobacteria bacterium UBA9273]HBL62137.1 hypothetical protein [Cyanobacteria bacterium UBA8803]
MLPLWILLLGGGLVSCGNVGQFSKHTIEIGDRNVNVTKIGDIQPDRQANTVVYLHGKVANLAPFLSAGAYQLQDATGKIWVLTNQTLPNVGDEVAIEGQLQFQSIPISGQEFGEVYVQEQQLLERKAERAQVPLFKPFLTN